MSNKYSEQIKQEIPIRQEYLGKFYPFFRILESMKAGKYKEYSHSTIVLALLSFMLYEGKLKEKKIFLTDIITFITNFMEESYGVILDEEEAKSFSMDLLGKVTNEGFKFIYEFYNPFKKALFNVDVNYIKGENDRKTGYDYYFITNVGIEFLLSTKEFGDESRISIYLLLIQKQLKNNNLDEVLNRLVSINAEIIKQIEEKQELIELLSYASNDKFDEYVNYKDRAIATLRDEDEMFTNTKAQVILYEEEYLHKMSKEEQQKVVDAPLMLEKIKRELEKNIINHAYLINATIELSNEIPKIRAERMRRMFKSNFNFEHQAEKILKLDDLENFKYLFQPLYKPKLQKTFNINKIKDMFSYTARVISEEEKEVNKELITGEVVYTVEHEVSERIECNFTFYTKALLNIISISKGNKTDLKEFISILKKSYGDVAIEHKDLMTYIYALLPHKKDKKRFIYSKLISEKEIHEIYKVYREIIKNDKDFEFIKDKEMICTPVKDDDYIEIDDILRVKNMVIEVR